MVAKKRKRYFWAGCLIAACALILFSGCTLYGNDRADTACIRSYEADGKLTFYGVNGSQDNLVFETRLGLLMLEEGQEDGFVAPVVLDGNTFPRHSFKMELGYEGLAEQLKTNGEYIQAYALRLEDGTAYGFCNVYTSATGYMSGGGQIDVKKVSRSLLYTYSPETNELTVLEEIEKGCVVAFNQTHAVYFYKKAYYAKEIGGAGEAVMICKDEAYDTGMTNYSYAHFYFDDAYCVLSFHRGHFSSKKDYDKYVLCTMDGTLLAQLKLPA